MLITRLFRRKTPLSMYYTFDKTVSVFFFLISTLRIKILLSKRMESYVNFFSDFTDIFQLITPTDFEG